MKISFVRYTTDFNNSQVALPISPSHPFSRLSPAHPFLFCFFSQTAKDRLAKPDEPVKPNFDGLKKWYDDQLPKEALFSQSDWKEARK